MDVINLHDLHVRALFEGLSGKHLVYTQADDEDSEDDDKDDDDGDEEF